MILMLRYLIVLVKWKTSIDGIKSCQISYIPFLNYHVSIKRSLTELAKWIKTSDYPFKSD